MWEGRGQLVGKVVAESSWEGKKRECVDPDWDTGVSLVTMGSGNLLLEEPGARAQHCSSLRLLCAGEVLLNACFLPQCWSLRSPDASLG